VLACEVVDFGQIRGRIRVFGISQQEADVMRVLISDERWRVGSSGWDVEMGQQLRLTFGTGFRKTGIVCEAKFVDLRRK
jgi:hypothetical protein